MDLQAYIDELRAEAAEFCRSGATEFGRPPELPESSLQMIETLGQAIRLHAQGENTALDTRLKYYRKHLQVAEFVWWRRNNPTDEFPRHVAPVDHSDKVEALLAAYPDGALFPVDDIDSRFGRDYIDGYIARRDEPGPLRDRARRTAESMVKTAKILWGREAAALYAELGYRFPASIAEFRGLRLNPETIHKPIPPHHEHFLAVHEALDNWESGDEEVFLVIAAHLLVGMFQRDIIRFAPSWLDVQNSQIILGGELAVDAPAWFCSRVASNGGVIASGSPVQRRRKCSEAAGQVRQVFIQVEKEKKIPCGGNYTPLAHLVTFYEWQVASTLLPVPAMSRLRHQKIARTERLRGHGKLVGELLALWQRQYPAVRGLRLLPSVSSTLSPP